MDRSRDRRMHRRPAGIENTPAHSAQEERRGGEREKEREREREKEKGEMARRQARLRRKVIWSARN